MWIILTCFIYNKVWALIVRMINLIEVNKVKEDVWIVVSGGL